MVGHQGIVQCVQVDGAGEWDMIRHTSIEPGLRGPWQLCACVIIGDSRGSSISCSGLDRLPQAPLAPAVTVCGFWELNERLEPDKRISINRPTPSYRPSMIRSPGSKSSSWHVWSERHAHPLSNRPFQER